jgi:hypothetical protein
VINAGICRLDTDNLGYIHIINFIIFKIKNIIFLPTYPTYKTRSGEGKQLFNTGLIQLFQGVLMFVDKPIHEIHGNWNTMNE